MDLERSIGKSVAAEQILPLGGNEAGATVEAVRRDQPRVPRRRLAAATRRELPFETEQRTRSEDGQYREIPFATFGHLAGVERVSSRDRVTALLYRTSGLECRK